MASSQPPSPEQIDARSQELWRLAGNPAGGADRYRAAAEAELRQQSDVTDAAANDPVSQPPERRQS